jgi:hypothetical protein
MRGAFVIPALTLAATVSAQPRPLSDVWGMFAHRAGVLVDATGQQTAQYAWQHEGELPECASIYWNTGVWFDPATGWKETFCVVGTELRLLGWGAITADPWITVSDGSATPGQAYARLDATEAYSVTVRGTATHASTVLHYVDSHHWTPTADGGWAHVETFQWVHDPITFTSVVQHAPGRMFVSADQTFSAGGLVTSRQLVRGSTWWQW